MKRIFLYFFFFNIPKKMVHKAYKKSHNKKTIFQNFEMTSLLTFWVVRHNYFYCIFKTDTRNVRVAPFVNNMTVWRFYEDQWSFLRWFSLMSVFSISRRSSLGHLLLLWISLRLFCKFLMKISIVFKLFDMDVWWALSRKWFILWKVYTIAFFFVIPIIFHEENILIATELVNLPKCLYFYFWYKG